MNYLAQGHGFHYRKGSAVLAGATQVCMQTVTTLASSKRTTKAMALKVHDLTPCMHCVCIHINHKHAQTFTQLTRAGSRRKKTFKISE